MTTAGAGLAPIGRRHFNPGNLRPAGGSGFQQFGSVTDGLAAMVRQVRRDQTHHGARTIAELIGGNPNVDHGNWAYAPAKDHNDTPAYVRNVSRKAGIAPTQRVNLSDENTLVRIIGPMIAQENGRNPFSDDQIRAVVRSVLADQKPAQHRHVHEFHGLPAGTKVRTTTVGSGVAVHNALPTR